MLDAPAGIVHRDLKLENMVMLNTADDSPVKIADFGLSKFISPETVLSTMCARFTSQRNCPADVGLLLATFLAEQQPVLARQLFASSHGWGCLCQRSARMTSPLYVNPHACSLSCACCLCGSQQYFTPAMAAGRLLPAVDEP
jgi:serine/threonine protein kinase